MISQLRSVIAALALVALTHPAALAATRQIAEVEVPDTSQVAGHTLILNGVALYEASFLQIDVFVAALYVERPTRDDKVASSCEGPVEFDFFWLYDPSLDQLASPWRETMRANAGADLPRLAARIDKLVAVLRGPAQGQRWRFVYAPGAGLTLIIDGAPVVTIPGQDFCQLFMSGHVGERADEDMRRGLLDQR